MKFNAMFKECMKPHSLAHMVSGAGIGFLVLYFVPSLTANLLMLGLILLVVALVWDFMVNPAK
jgi:hypothetical protein